MHIYIHIQKYEYSCAYLYRIYSYKTYMLTHKPTNPTTPTTYQPTSTTHIPYKPNNPCIHTLQIL